MGLTSDFARSVGVESDSRKAPWVIMLYKKKISSFQMPLSIYGRPTNVKSEYARFPDENAAKEELRMLAKAVADHKDSIPNRHYDMRDLPEVWKMFNFRPHPIA
jgi:hypothetical protein